MPPFIPSLLDIIAPQGALISFLSCGEFMEYVVGEGPSGKGAQFLQRIYSLGGQIGSHSHSEYQIGPHLWRNVPPNPTAAQEEKVLDVKAILAKARQEGGGALLFADDDEGVLL